MQSELTLICVVKCEDPFHAVCEEICEVWVGFCDFINPRMRLAVLIDSKILSIVCILIIGSQIRHSSIKFHHFTANSSLEYIKL